MSTNAAGEGWAGNATGTVAVPPEKLLQFLARLTIGGEFIRDVSGPTYFSDSIVAASTAGSYWRYVNELGLHLCYADPNPHRWASIDHEREKGAWRRLCSEETHCRRRPTTFATMTETLVHASPNQILNFLIATMDRYKGSTPTQRRVLGLRKFFQFLEFRSVRRIGPFAGLELYFGNDHARSRRTLQAALDTD